MYLDQRFTTAMAFDATAHDPASGRFIVGKSETPGNRNIHDKTTKVKVGEIRKNTKKGIGGYIAKHHETGYEGAGRSHAEAIVDMEYRINQGGSQKKINAYPKVFKE